MIYLRIVAKYCLCTYAWSWILGICIHACMYRKEVYIDLVQNLKSEPGVTVSVQKDNKTMSCIYRSFYNCQNNYKMLLRSYNKLYKQWRAVNTARTPSYRRVCEDRLNYHQYYSICMHVYTHACTGILYIVTATAQSCIHVHVCIKIMVFWQVLWLWLLL